MHSSGYEITILCDGTDHKQTDRLSLLLRNFAQEENLSVHITVHPDPYLTLRTADHLYRLYAEDLCYLISDGHYCVCHMTSGAIRLRVSFHAAITQLLQYAAADANISPFLHINRGILVSRRHINGHTRDAFVMCDGTALTVRRADRTRLFREWDTRHGQHIPL